MKIEKLTDDKIRIILKSDDLRNRDININSILSSSPESQSLFLEILDKAEKEIAFYTDGHKLLIETYFQDNDVIICIITKYIESLKKSIKLKKYVNTKNTFNSKNNIKNNVENKNLNIKKKEFNATFNYIYQFKDFESFCDYCDFLKNRNDLKVIFKYSILYFYKNYYYLVINKSIIININTEKNKNKDKTISTFNILSTFHAITLEFLTHANNTKNLEIKLKEYGKIIIKNNAINVGIKFFTYK